MQYNKLRFAIRSTAAAAILGVAGQANAVDLNIGDVDAELYGYARLNAAYDIDENINEFGTQAGQFNSVDTSSGDTAAGFFDADAEQSRLGVNVTHSSGVKVNLETDFRGGTFRIRHAYGEYGNWLAGRTWSNFNSFVGYTSTLDFDSLAGNAGVQDRAAQVRYTTGPVSFSLEDPRFQRIGASEGTTIVAAGDKKQSLPVATARFQQSISSAVTVSFAGLVQQLSVDNGTDDDSALGFGAFAAARLALSDMISIQGALNYTNGANGYLYRSGNGGFGAQDAYLNGNDLETLAGYGGTLGMGVNLGAGNSVNVGYGFATVDWDDAEDDLGAAVVADRHETNSNLFLNYKMTPVENVMVGVEYGYFMVDEVGGDDGDANRILFAAQYDF